MIDHVILTVSDFGRSVVFYAQALKPLGITNFVDYEGHTGHPDLKGFGDGKRAFFWLKEGKPDPRAIHVGFAAKDRAEVDAFLSGRTQPGALESRRYIGNVARWRDAASALGDSPGSDPHIQRSISSAASSATLRWVELRPGTSLSRMRVPSWRSRV